MIDHASKKIKVVQVAESRLRVVSKDSIKHLLEISIPDKAKKVMKYGMKLFNGKDVLKKKNI